MHYKLVLQLNTLTVKQLSYTHPILTNSSLRNDQQCYKLTNMPNREMLSNIHLSKKKKKLWFSPVYETTLNICFFWTI